MQAAGTIKGMPVYLAGLCALVAGIDIEIAVNAIKPANSLLETFITVSPPFATGADD